MPRWGLPVTAAREHPGERGGRTHAWRCTGTTSMPTAPTGPGQDAPRSSEPEPHPPGEGDPPPRALLVGVDGSDCALAAVRWAAEEAQRRDVPLRIVHAAPYV